MTTLYKCFNAGGELMYVGIADKWLSRMRQHSRTASWWGQIASVNLEHHAERNSALAAERLAIRSLHPLYNVQHALPRPRGRLCPLSPKWVELLAAEPRLAAVEKLAANPRKPEWYKWHGARWAMARLVGHLRDEPERPFEFGKFVTLSGDDPDEPASRERKARDVARGLGWLWIPLAYDTAYHHLFAVEVRHRPQGYIAQIMGPCQLAHPEVA